MATDSTDEDEAVGADPVPWRQRMERQEESRRRLLCAHAELADSVEVSSEQEDGNDSRTPHGSGPKRDRAWTDQWPQAASATAQRRCLPRAQRLTA